MLRHKFLLNYESPPEPVTQVTSRSEVIHILNSLLPDIPSSAISILFLNLDDFRTMNESLGYIAGDHILCEMKERIRRHIHPKDYLLHLGGDEFILIIPRHLCKEAVLQYTNNIKNRLSEPISINKKRISLTASIGVSLCWETDTSAEMLLKASDAAMRQAKRYGKNGVFVFADEVRCSFQREMEIKSGLWEAIARDELLLFFQPQYCTTTNRLRGVEALVRWNSSTLGSVSPNEFIPVAEETKLIVPIGNWILENALFQFKEIQNTCPYPILLSVNISVLQIMDPHFLTIVFDTLQKTGVPPGSLELEITESICINSIDEIIKILTPLKTAGIRIAIDDFGKGYSSLSYLQKLPIETLKIDKSFIDSICITDDQNQIVGMIISLVHKMNLEVVAEGVENNIQLHYLKQHHCDYIQGFILGRPSSKEEICSLF